jgi:hypothetical protein
MERVTCSTVKRAPLDEGPTHLKMSSDSDKGRARDNANASVVILIALTYVSYAFLRPQYLARIDVDAVLQVTGTHQAPTTFVLPGFGGSQYSTVFYHPAVVIGSILMFWWLFAYDTVKRLISRQDLSKKYPYLSIGISISIMVAMIASLPVRLFVFGYFSVNALHVISSYYVYGIDIPLHEVDSPTLAAIKGESELRYGGLPRRQLSDAFIAQQRAHDEHQASLQKMSSLELAQVREAEARSLQEATHS